MHYNVTFIDAKIAADGSICDIGAVRYDGALFHSNSVCSLSEFLCGTDFLCSHNLCHHDLCCLIEQNAELEKYPLIDTLLLAPLLLPNKSCQLLDTNEKISRHELNNHIDDCKTAECLLCDEVRTYRELTIVKQQIFCTLLGNIAEFSAFFEYVGKISDVKSVAKLIHTEYNNKLCANARLDLQVRNAPVELSYTLAHIGAKDAVSLIPPWLLNNYPQIVNVYHLLCNVPCKKHCEYCQNALGIHNNLKSIFGFDEFRVFNGEPLQEKAVRAAVEGRSLLSVFPTGGGKSLTFQLPALIAGRCVGGLTVVISPLQSLMKDQVDSLTAAGISEAVTINGMLSPIERAGALRQVAEGSASILYISPEMLRSRTIERLLMSRNVVRFVVDEAHCFSSWGQDFRVDYLYIGDFIRSLQEKKRLDRPIPVSCFTATAKQKVICDIREHFKKKVGVELELFAAQAKRENLRYYVLHMSTVGEKYSKLRSIIARRKCPTIVYVAWTSTAVMLANRLTSDGYPALPFHGKMEPPDKIANQNAFMRDEVSIIVATSAFGMGVDKKDVQLVIHYDISCSIEDYIQESGRAGRDASLTAECYALYRPGDLDNHFFLLNSSMLIIDEIRQVWTAIKELTKSRKTVCASPLEIARTAGWDDIVPDYETRVKTAVSALENVGYIKRGQNVPQVYATGLLASSMEDAAFVIDRSELFDAAMADNAKRIIASLIISNSITRACDDNETRIDYLADRLGLTKKAVIDAVTLLRSVRLLADTQEMSAFIFKKDTQNRSTLILDRFARLERFLLDSIQGGLCSMKLKSINEAAQEAGIVGASVRSIRTLLHYMTIKGIIRKNENRSLAYSEFVPCMPHETLISKLEMRIDICKFVLAELYRLLPEYASENDEQAPVKFSTVKLHSMYRTSFTKQSKDRAASIGDIEDALLYLSKIGAMKLEGGFLVAYNGMELERLVDSRNRYKVDDYKLFDEYYKHKIQQIHLVGEYADMMAYDSEGAQKFVQDYFQLDYRRFIKKYFDKSRANAISRSITYKRYEQLFGALSKTQLEIISDSESKYIVVAAVPGSGKTMLLVHKLASLLLLENVKHEQLLMLTFSRAAATEFKKRLYALIGNAAALVEIKTFHSYCFDVIGTSGSLERSDSVVSNAVTMIENGEAEAGAITKSVLVIDEAQDMDKDEFDLVCALMRKNEDMRVIAVGDDDQCIYDFRHADSRYFRSLISEYGAAMYEMNENFRSAISIVALSNSFSEGIRVRMKAARAIPVQNNCGTVIVTHHSGKHLEQALVNRIKQTYVSGSACVLTNTNNEALLMTALLNREGVRARLIQSMDGFSLCSLAELRYFLRIIDESTDAPVISEEIWNDAKERTLKRYSRSTCIEICRNLFHEFESVYATKYRSDFYEFANTSRFEDFYDDRADTVLVSTIHKSKGREFDSVYMLLDGVALRSDEDRRKLYVGMTRAKEALYIHCNTAIFSAYDIPNVCYENDTNVYSEPDEQVLSLSYRDVYLDFFKNKKDKLLRLMSGDVLQVVGTSLIATIDGVTFPACCLSQKGCAQLEMLRNIGYIAVDAVIDFIVAWKGENDTEECAVILPSIRLHKACNS